MEKALYDFGDTVNEDLDTAGSSFVVLLRQRDISNVELELRKFKRRLTSLSELSRSAYSITPEHVMAAPRLSYRSIPGMSLVATDVLPELEHKLEDMSNAGKARFNPVNLFLAVVFCMDE